MRKTQADKGDTETLFNFGNIDRRLLANCVSDSSLFWHQVLIIIWRNDKRENCPVSLITGNITDNDFYE